LFKSVPVTLIVPGKVKVDLANFNEKLQENVLCTLKKINKYLPVPAETYCKYFLLHTQHKK
jgi:hypothetical protein